MAPETQALTNIVARIIDTRRAELRISPSWVATEAMIEIDPDRSSVELVYQGCHLQLRQIARSLLRLHFENANDPADDESAQHELFPELQWRYPAAHSAGGEPQYV